MHLQTCFEMFSSTTSEIIVSRTGFSLRTGRRGESTRAFKGTLALSTARRMLWRAFACADAVVVSALCHKPETRHGEIHAILVIVFTRVCVYPSDASYIPRYIACWHWGNSKVFFTLCRIRFQPHIIWAHPLAAMGVHSSCARNSNSLGYADRWVERVDALANRVLR